MKRLWVLTVLFIFSCSAFAQTSEHEQNLSTCLQGYPALCEHSRLTPSEASRVAEAEHEQNLSTCLQGYPALCEHSRLTPSEASRVAEAEHEQNLSTCLQGYPALCEHSRLTPSEASRVAEAEHEQNLSTCLQGYSALCDHSRLTPSEASKVDAGARASTAGPLLVPGVAENGSYYGEPNANGVPKTVRVNGYYRKDGTYVRGHYRSAPGTNPPRVRKPH